MAVTSLLVCILAGSIIVEGAVLDRYGPPAVPHETYGPPTRSLILEQPREVSRSVRPKEGKIILESVRPLDRTVVPVVSVPKTVVPKRPIHISDERNQYAVGFENPDGTVVKEEGRLISTDNGWEYVIAKTGSYKYTSPEGKLVEVEWIADEKGFRILSTTV